MGRSSAGAIGFAEFTTIVLLCGEGERKPLGAALKRHTPRLRLVKAVTAADLAALEPAVLAHARLVAFLTPVLVPASVLGALGYGAYNIHPGPPDYPGWHPVEFAVYDGAARFGATAHVMAESVDSGPIIAVERFDVSAGTEVEELGRTAYEAAVRLFAHLAPALAGSPEPLPTLDLRWGARRTSRRAYAALCEISPDLPAEEVRRRVAAFGPGDGFSRPAVILHGIRFSLESPGKS